MTKLKKNFIYNIAFQILNLCLPIITVPYISRTLGVEGSGIYSYTYSIVNYFMIFAMLGISNYGNRKIAKCRENKNDLAKEFISLYTLQIVLTTISLIIYILYCMFISNYKIVSWIEILFLFSTLLDISWLYFGLEEFKKTVTKNILIKVISLILILLFVKDSNAIYTYTLIMAISTFISQLVLWKGIKNYIDFKNYKLDKNDVIKHIKGTLVLFIPVISYSIYKIMDKIMLGLLSNIEEVGYYEYAEKIINIPIGFITALGTVMLPKISNLVEKEEFDSIKKYLFRALKFIMFFAIPSCLGLISIGTEFSILFLGEEYLRTGIIIKYLSITIIFTAWANVIRTQWLIPKEKDSIYISTTIIGAFLNLFINLILIPKFGAVGASIGTICSEFGIMFLQSFLSRKEIRFNVIFKNILQFVIAALIMFIWINIVGSFINNIYLKLIVECILGVTIYAVLNYKYIKKEILMK